MRNALQYRFPTVFDAWCFFDPEPTWDVPVCEFRRKAALLKLPEEPVDVEGVIRKLDTEGNDILRYPNILLIPNIVSASIDELPNRCLYATFEQCTTDLHWMWRSPMNFVNILQWHDLGAGMSDLREAFDTAAKRRAIVADVALRRSREPTHRRAPLMMPVVQEVTMEKERQRKERRKRRAAEIHAKQQRLRELFGPPQIFKDFARQRDWKRLLDLEVDVVRLSSALAEMHVAAQQVTSAFIISP